MKRRPRPSTRQRSWRVRSLAGGFRPPGSWRTAPPALWLFLKAAEPPWAIDHEQHHGQTVGDLLDRADFRGGQIGQIAKAGRQEQDEEGADDRPYLSCRAADYDHCHDLDGRLKQEAL